MARRLLLALALATLALAPVAHAAITQTPDVTDTRYQSTLRSVVPSVPGVTWKVIDRGDEIQLINHSGRTVTVYAYQTTPFLGPNYSGGPYARIKPDGTVEVNESSPAYYLNQSFYEGGVSVPATASATAPPHWVTLAKTGSFIWHDHRIHYLTPIVPASIRKRGLNRRQFVFNWYVPFTVGTRRGYLAGQLYWVGQKGFSFPAGAIIALIVVVIGGAAFVVVVRRRRGPRAEREAW